MHLAKLTNCPWRILRSVVRRESHPYQIFQIRKRSGGNRLICAPHSILMRAQRWIHDKILLSPGALARLSSASSAYAPGCSIISNAKRHVGAKWMVKLDIKDFFESVSERQVYHVFKDLGYPSLLSFELARMCTRVAPARANGTLRPREYKWRWTNTARVAAAPHADIRDLGHLPQGAPSSGMLANLAFAPQDREIEKIAEEYGGEYSRYADDIVISLGEVTKVDCERILSRVARVVTLAGYRVNHTKTRVYGPGSRKIVTGLVVNDNVPRLTRQYKDDLSLCLYHIGRHGLLSHMAVRHSVKPLGYLNHIVGKILFAHSVEPAFGRRCMMELRSAMSSHRELYSMIDELELRRGGEAEFESLHADIF
ncbi:reverse transcriptase family protein [Stenotrophomonas sp. CFBP8994]|uniref:reverse transcriptase family protein n=1 Tax=Stenotrophomonas sp. CFBP8994 TaxID=3096527 RepID=UPI002A6AB8D8|nr:reverse transcriptase family protein [Stenotrophomonas sp. CFBP8994]MDY0979822.1 reverse transcriptase family protein [Stenotrophomonas sp. CFBP8994]